MAGNASNYLEEAIAKHITRVAAYTMPTALYLGLSPDTYVEDTTLTEFTGGNYARVNVSSSFSWDAGLGKVKNIQILWPVLTSTLADALSWILYDQSLNVLETGALVDPIAMVAGTTPRVVAGSALFGAS